MTVNEKLNGVLEFVKKYSEENCYAPSVREICSALNIKSTATCQYYLNKLVKSGELNRDESKSRTLNLKKDGVSDFVSAPLIGAVTAGTPVFAYENFEEFYPLPKEFAADSELFILRVRGESMINAGILDGDKIIVKKQNSAENGEIVVALIDDSATVKRFYKKDDEIILHPENDAMSDIIVKDAVILGVVSGLLRKY